MSDAIITVRLTNGATIFLNPNDMIGRVIYYFGDFDPKITWVCRRTLRHGDTVIDIGANVGLVSLIAARLAGPTGRVHSFEPQTELADLIRKSLEVNHYHWVTVYPVALSDSDREATLFVPSSGTGYGSLEYYFPDRSLSVELKHAGRYLSEVVGNVRTRLLKIDVEGHEAAVFRGARDYLRSNPPDFILFELSGSEPFWDQERVHILDELGYDFLGIPHVIWPMRLERIEFGRPPRGDIRDAIAVRRGPDQTYLNQTLGIR